MTSRRTWQIVFSFLILTALALGLVQVPTPVAQAKPAAQDQPILVPTVGESIKNDLSRPLIELAKEAGKAPQAGEDRPLGWMPKTELAAVDGFDGALAD